MRLALSESLTICTSLSIGIFQNSMMGIIVEKRLRYKLVAAMKLMGIIETKNFDALALMPRNEGQ